MIAIRCNIAGFVQASEETERADEENSQADIVEFPQRERLLREYVP